MRFGGRFAAVAGGVVGSLLLFASSAGAVAVEVNSFPWPAPGNYGDPGATPTAHGACNLTQRLNGSGSSDDQPQALSLACQIAVPSSYSTTSGTFGRATFSIPGATCSSTKDSANYCNWSSVVYTGNQIRFGPQSYHLEASNNSYADRSGVAGAYYTNPWYGSADFFANRMCGDIGAHIQDCYDVYNNLHADTACTIESLTVGTTVTNGYKALQFRQNCMIEPHGGALPIKIADGSSSTGDCSIASNGIVKVYLFNNATVDASETSVCVMSGGDPEAKMPDSYWTGGSAIDSSACSAISVGPGGAGGLDAVAGHQYRFTVTYTGPATKLVVSPDPKGTTYTGGSYITLATVPGNWSKDTTELDATGSPQAVDLVMSATATVYPHFYCWNGAALYDLGPPGGVGNTTECALGGTTSCTPTGGGASVCGYGGVEVGTAGCAVDLSVCLDSTGLGLNPVTWVPGLVSDMGCLLSWAFLPLSISTTSLADPIIGAFPFNWLNDGMDGVSTLLSGFNDAASQSACDAPSFGTGPFSVSGRTLSVGATLPAPASLGCSGDQAASAGELFGYRSNIRNIFVLITWLGALALVWRMMPWVGKKADEMPLLGDGIEGSSGGAG